MSLARGFTIVGAATLVSRITGFVRDMLVAAVLGAAAVADAYVAAFLLPNLFRRLIGEGAFNAAYVPIFARRRAEGGEASAAAFAEGALSLMLAVGALIIVVAELFMPAIIATIAPGFDQESDTFADAVAFGRVVMPFVAIVLLTAVFTGTLNALDRFAIAAWAPILLNVLLIGVLLHALATGLSGQRGAGFLLVWTIVIAGLVTLAIMAVGAWRAGFRPTGARPRFDADVRRLTLLALPGIAVAGAGHINVVVAAQIASGAPSGMAWLYFAERIFQMPLGFVAAAIGVVLLPAVSRALAEGDSRSARAAESRALEFALLVTLPAAAALIMLAEPIVSIIYERGAFAARDAEAVAALLRALAVGLPAFVLVKVLLPAFLAREDMRRPMLAALAGVLANIAVAMLLFPVIGPVAAAWGVTASAFVNAGLLAALLIRRGLFRIDQTARRRLPRALLVCAITAAATWALADQMAPLLDRARPGGARLAALAALCGVVVLIHAAAAAALGAVDRREVMEALRR